jgi:uridine phosphorylase
MAAPIMANVTAPTTPRGHTFHVHVKTEDVANRVLSVGDQGRAERIAGLLDPGSVVKIPSDRGYCTYTGTFRGVKVTIVATLIGYPNMDIVIRELRYACKGPMAVVRLGTCGGLGATAVGTVSVPAAAVFVRLEPDYRGPEPPPAASGGMPSAALPYSVSRPVAPDAELAALLGVKMRIAVNEGMGRDWPVAVGGLHGTGDSFFSSQGRASSAFDDRNSGLIAALLERHPSLGTLEMETFHLFELARSTTASAFSSADAPSSDSTLIRAAGAHIVILNRFAGTATSSDDLHALERIGGQGALEALVELAL